MGFGSDGGMSATKTPGEWVAAHPRWKARTNAAWALEIVLKLHGVKLARRYPFQQERNADDWAPEFLAVLRERGIETEIENYGRDFARFEAELERRGELPVVRVPVSVEIGRAGMMRIRSGAFVAVRERGKVVFLGREARTREVMSITLKQMRLLHEAWASWPAVMPSMLLSVLWHRRAKQRSS